MEEILHAFGIDWRLIVIQIVNFGLLVLVLWYFLYTPVLKLLAEREAKIKKGVEDAEEAERMRKDADTEKSQILKDAHSEAHQIVARGTQHAEEKAEAFLKETEERITRELNDARAQGELIKERLRKESESEIAQLAILGAEQILRKEHAKK